MNNFFLKKLLPKKLLHRLLLIFLVPLIITQASVVFFFYERHWEKIIDRFSNIAANKISVILYEYKKGGIIEAKKIAEKLNLVIYNEEIEYEFNVSKRLFEKKIEEIVSNRVLQTLDVNFTKEQVFFRNNINGNVLYIVFPRKYLLSETPIILFLWMISTSLILSLIAFLFLRIQIRAIQRLAVSAEEFGKGKEITIFKPSGATEIRQAGNAFLKMKKRINNYISQRTSFLAGISHDLGTIITRIKLRLELINKTENIIQIKNDIEIMQTFLSEYLDFSEKINVTKISKINLFYLIDEVIKSSNLKKKKVNLICSKKNFVFTDKNCLFRIIFNLFENAIKFGDSVKINVKKNTNNFHIEIQDDGPGIPYQQRSKIFKPFYKIDDSRNLEKGGSGLGLSIASELSKKIKVKIRIKSYKNNGSTFIILIPFEI